LIGCEWKCREARSGAVLIGRGLNQKAQKAVRKRRICNMCSFEGTVPL
jgi:hypothetical protein